MFRPLSNPTQCASDVDADIIICPPKCTKSAMPPAQCLCLDVKIMRALLASLPSLETLEFSEPIRCPTLSLSALAKLAPLCPCVKSLTLCMDTSQLSVSTPPTTRFSCLKVLDLGISPLKSSALDVVAFLGMVLPKGWHCPWAMEASIVDYNSKTGAFPSRHPL